MEFLDRQTVLDKWHGTIQRIGVPFSNSILETELAYLLENQSKWMEVHKNKNCYWMDADYTYIVTKAFGSLFGTGIADFHAMRTPAMSFFGRDLVVKTRKLKSYYNEEIETAQEIFEELFYEIVADKKNNLQAELVDDLTFDEIDRIELKLDSRSDLRLNEPTWIVTSREMAEKLGWKATELCGPSLNSSIGTLLWENKRIFITKYNFVTIVANNSFISSVPPYMYCPYIPISLPEIDKNPNFCANPRFSMIYGKRANNSFRSSYFILKECQFKNIKLPKYRSIFATFEQRI